MDLITVPEVAERLDIGVSRVRQLLRDGELLATREEPDGPLLIPAEFLGDGGPLKGLPGTLTLLRDARFSDEEAMSWLFRDEPQLGRTPVASLLAGHIAAVRRVAMTLGF